MWNPGAPTIGQAPPITSMEALSAIVTLPDVASIAAKELHFTGGPVVLASQVEATVDQVSGFLDITATAVNPKRAVTVSTAFSTALVAYLAQLNVTRIDQQQRLVGQQIQTLQHEGADPAVIAALRAEIPQLALSRTTPVPITTIQRAVAVPVAPADSTKGSSSAGLQIPKSRTARAVLGALLGLLLGLALALVLERFDSRIRSAAGAEKAFGLPVLAEVPAISRRRRHKVVTASHPYSRAADAFRLVGVGTARWTANGHSGNGGGETPAKTGATTILVTSAEARDGKTTVAANLAVAHAQAGSRVLVVSCDLRRPAIHESFGVAIGPGLTDAVRASNGSGSAAPADLSPYLEPCSIVRVGVVPSGTAPDHPGELLGSPNVQRFIERLKKVTDVVILDCAPLVVASDVVPLLPQADGVVLVARAGKTRGELAGNAATLLERLGTTRAGVVLNDAREFSIPLAKRRMYRPTRKMRKAANAAEGRTHDEPAAVEHPAAVDGSPVRDVVRLDETPDPQGPAVADEPTVEYQIPDVAPSHSESGSGSGPSVEASDREPVPWAPPVAQVLAPERIVVTPPASPPGAAPLAALQQRARRAPHAAGGVPCGRLAGGSAAVPERERQRSRWGGP